MLAPSRRRRLRAKVQHVLRSTMLCCGRRKEAREPVAGELVGGRRATGARARAAAQLPEMVVQGDFRKVSGISTEIFNQIQAVENDHDATTAASLEAVERRGEMMIRILDPRTMGRSATERARRFVGREQGDVVQFIEIVKRPGQTLGLYIREGNGVDRHEGVFISRIALESAVYNSGCLHVGDEILAVNLVDVTNVSLDDVVIIMSIPRRLVLTLCSRRNAKGHRQPPVMRHVESKGPPVVVIKKELEEEPQEESSNGENGILTLLPGPPPPPHAPYAVLEPAYVMEPRAPSPYDDPYLYYNSQPRVKYRHPRMSPAHMAPPPQHYQQPHTYADRDVWLTEPGPSTAAYPRIVTDQPRTLHAYPKTLESLAEKVHAFYAAPARPEPGGRRRVPPHGHPVPGARTLPPSRSERTLAPSQPRVGAGGRLLRAESDQRLVGLARGEHYYGAVRSMQVPMATLPQPPLRPSLKPTPPLPPVPRHRHHHHPPAPPPTTSAMQAARRLSALRRRAHADSSLSDTEAHMTMPRSSILVRPDSRTGLRPGASTYGLRSNSLPRMRSEYGGRRHRHTVRFERDIFLPPVPHDSQDESDGAVSAPELPVRRERTRIPSSPSVFTAAEYRAWLNRAPSTSAIYEQLKKSREVLQAQRAARVTYSAENLLDHRGEERLFHRTLPSRSHGYRTSRWGPMDAVATIGSRRVRYLLDDGRHIPHPTPIRASDFRVHLLDINPAEFLKYRPEKELLSMAAEQSVSRSPGDVDDEGGGGSPNGLPVEGQEGFSGLLWVHLLAGRGLKASGRADHFRDLYCVLECDHVHKARTVVRTGDQNFDWDETFELDLLDNHELDLLVYSWDPEFRHKLCYRGSLQLETLLCQSAMHQLALKIEPRGTLYLKLRYTDPGHAFQRLPSPRRTGGLFGVDLETIVNRENSGLSVPLLLKRCIDEVECRGLDIIGIYRLCGSASKKRMLKEAFERNPRRVDTSPDNVPDINVITGVLKDYLRELPEPLFTKCLNQMLVDALSVCLPDDPEGNAKLMFSILDCLPKVNRCTLIMLMDHLKLVASQSERNKMTVQNISLCFGPILLVHTDSITATADFRTPVQLLKYLLEIWPLKPENPGSDESANGQSPGQPEPSDQLPEERLGAEVEDGAEDEETTTALATTPTNSTTQTSGVGWTTQQRILSESSC